MLENINGRPTRTMSERQLGAIELLASGSRVDEVADEILVPAALIRQWQRDPMFRFALKIRMLYPRPPQVDFIDSIVRGLKKPDQGQPWTSEATEGDEDDV